MSGYYDINIEDTLMFNSFDCLGPICKLCQRVCPADAIKFTSVGVDVGAGVVWGDTTFSINEFDCILCGACAEVCPTMALTYSGGAGGNEPIPPEGGGGGGGATPPTNTQLKNAIVNKPFALFDLPCDLIRSWLSVAKYVPGQSILDKLSSISYPTPVTEFYGIKPEDILHIQNINDAYSLVVNMDYFPIHVDELPIYNGTRLTPGQFLNLFRLNISTFSSDKAIFTPYQAYGVNDVALWNSNSPVGSIINIDFELWDNGSVITSYADPTRWIFTTVHEPIYGDHPVSGNRIFGYIENGDGSYTFYTQGVDRLTTWDSSTLQEMFGVPFNMADALWTTYQNNISNYINDNGGQASVVSPQIHRPDWQLVKDVIDGKRPLSDLSKDCPDN